ncbi:MAG: pyridoxal phosphate-dependent aminotransferase [Sphingomonadales bacterium]
MHLLQNPIRSELLLTKTLNIKHRFYASSSEPLSHKYLMKLTEEKGYSYLIELFNNHSLGYAENGGSVDLREEVAKLYGPNIGPENIVIFPGAQTGMTLTSQALLTKEDHSIIITPSYQSLEEGAKLFGKNFTRVALSPENDWEINLEAVEASIRLNTKYLLLNDPHNPTGALMSLETKQGLIKLAEHYGFQIFSDEVYRLLEFSPQDRSPSMADLSTKCISLGTMSKPWGAGGTGIGWIVCQNKKVIEKTLRAQHIYSVCFSRAGEIQAMMTLKLSDQIISRNMKIIEDNLTMLDQFFKDYENLFEWVRPKAGGTGFVKFKGPISGDKLASELLEEGILVFPPSIFHCEENLAQYFRIGFSRKKMMASLEAFKKFINKNREQWLKNK